MARGWVSAMASNQPQWLVHEYSLAFVALQAGLTQNALYADTQIEIQALNGENWELLLSIDVDNLLFDADAEGFATVDLPLSTSDSYTDFRVFAKQNPFLWIKRFEI